MHIAILGAGPAGLYLAYLIKRRRPEHAGLLIGLYLAALAAGAIAGSVVAVPLFNATGQ